MSWNGDPVWLADVLRAEGVEVREWRDADGYDWKGIGHGDFGDVWGVLWHHMGVNDQGADVIRNGVPGLDGPIANIHLSRDGVATIVAAGVAWHAGAGSWPGLPTNNANNRLIGVEMAGNGKDPWPPACWDAAVKVGAAISRFLGYGADRNIAHKEWAGAAQGKWDPGNWDMNVFRDQIQARLNGQVPQGDSDDMSWGEHIQNLEGDTVSREDQVDYIDLHVGQVLDQLGGPDTHRGAYFPGWPQLGHRTVVDAIAAIGAKLGVDGMYDVKAVRK